MQIYSLPLPTVLVDTLYLEKPICVCYLEGTETSETTWCPKQSIGIRDTRCTRGPTSRLVKEFPERQTGIPGTGCSPYTLWVIKSVLVPIRVWSLERSSVRASVVLFVGVMPKTIIYRFSQA